MPLASDDTLNLVHFVPRPSLPLPAPPPDCAFVPLTQSRASAPSALLPSLATPLSRFIFPKDYSLVRPGLCPTPPSTTADHRSHSHTGTTHWFFPAPYLPICCRARVKAAALSGRPPDAHRPTSFWWILLGSGSGSRLFSVWARLLSPWKLSIKML